MSLSYYSFITSPLILFCFTAFFTFLLHLFILLKHNFSDLTWKKADYFWIPLTAFGIFGASNDIEVYVSENMLKYQETPRLVNSYEYIYHFIESEASPSGANCTERVRVESPYALPIEEFNLLNNNFKKQCIFFQNIFKKMPSSIKEPFPTFDKLELPKSIKYLVNDNYSQEHYVKLVKDYQEQYLIYTNTKEKTEPSNFNLFLLFLSPLFLSIGLSIRLTKVTGDILNTRKKN